MLRHFALALLIAFCSSIVFGVAQYAHASSCTAEADAVAAAQAEYDTAVRERDSALKQAGGNVLAWIVAGAAIANVAGGTVGMVIGGAISDDSVRLAKEKVVAKKAALDAAKEKLKKCKEKPSHSDPNYWAGSPSEKPSEPNSDDEDGSPNSDDGDGSPNTDDDDGSPNSDDGDGSPNTNDGDGSPNTDDDDGSPNSDDGDGSPNTNDGDGSPNTEDDEEEEEDDDDSSPPGIRVPLPPPLPGPG